MVIPYQLACQASRRCATDCKGWYTAHKAARKAKLTQEKADHKVTSDKAKLDLKLLLKTGDPREAKTG